MRQRGCETLLTNALCNGSAIFCKNSVKGANRKSDGARDQLRSKIAIDNVGADDTQAAPIDSVSARRFV